MYLKDPHVDDGRLSECKLTFLYQFVEETFIRHFLVEFPGVFKRVVQFLGHEFQQSYHVGLHFHLSEMVCVVVEIQTIQLLRLPHDIQHINILVFLVIVFPRNQILFDFIF